jgi:3',5'-cyclic AMP phosphodiesterase CpdA
MIADIADRRPDHIIFSGDATALGFESEIRRAAEVFRVGDASMPAGLAVPGNHDYCTRPAAASGLFERYFAPWQQGIRVDAETYPFAQRVGHLMLIAVNSCTGNVWPFDAAGSVGPAQLERLKQLLCRLEPGPRILVTHYPICRDNGRAETKWHGLRDLKDLLRVATEGGVSLWLHGHRHHAYSFDKTTDVPFPVICAGSATQNHLWSYAEYTVEGCNCRMQQRVFDPGKGEFRDGTNIELQLSSAGQPAQSVPNLA